MESLFRTRITLVWTVLVAATVLSWEMGHGVGLHDIRYASAAIIAVAFIKVRLVILDFMELRNAPLLMRCLGEAWVIVVCSILIALYLMAH